MGHTREISLAAIYDEMASIRDGSCRSTSQVRIEHPDDPRKRVHPDRILHEGPTLEESHFVQVIEEKCPDSVPEAPWDGWVYQLQWAMGLLQLAYPAAQVNGVLFASDLAGNRTDFGTLWKPNPAVFRELQEKADGLLNHMAAGSTPDPEPDLLCGHCPFVEGCPAYADPLEVPLSDELVGTVHRLRDLAKAKKRVLGEYGAAKKRVLAALFPRGLPRSSWKKELGGVPTSFYWGAGRRETHYGRLAEAFPEAYAACVTEGKPYPVLRTR